MRLAWMARLWHLAGVFHEAAHCLSAAITQVQVELTRALSTAQARQGDGLVLSAALAQLLFGLIGQHIAVLAKQNG
jgi:hypothetical protein